MNSRTAEILEAAVQGFITTGEPVSSGWLFQNYDFGIKPAMIRLELDALEENGYLEQPHHAAGRVPTDAGYEFFAKRMLDVKSLESRETALQGFFEEHAWQDLMQEISAELGLLSIVADLSRDMVYKTGLDALVNNFDWENREGIRSVIRDFEGVDARLPRAAERLGEGTNIFIGKKSPVTKSEDLSVVAANYKVGNTTIAIFAIGPKRMDYRKTIRIFKSL